MDRKGSRLRPQPPARATLLLLGFTLAACSAASPAPQETQPSITDAPPTTTAREAEAGCLPIHDPRPTPSADLFQQPDRITTYLDQGGSLEGLLHLAQESRLLPYFPNALRGVFTDLDGDQRADVAFSLRTQDAGDSLQRPGSLFLWLCRDDGYYLQELLLPESAHDAPVLFGADDLTGDGPGELVFGRPSCGAHTCFLELGILQWNGETFIDRWSGSSKDLPTPSVSVHPAGPGSSGSVAVTSGGVQSVGAGPPRPRTRVWSWDPSPQQFLPGPDVLSDPVFRIHVVHDADASFEAADYDRAADLYRRALDGRALLDWDASPASPPRLMAYVHYRLVLLALTRDGEAAARASYNAMVEASMGVPEADDYVTMARLLVESPAAFDLPGVCAVVREFAADHQAQILDPLYYGYDNRIYTADDLCPLKE